ncbi:MAG: transcription termination factor NusA [Spirochaetales bacterium]|jgi:N utilization substance protein A|nr:transcription termination factor NusA [Spirochaetales bacterium]
MATNLGDAIRMYVQEKGVAEELVLKTIEESVFAAYKRKYGTQDNVVVRFNDEGTEMAVFAKKRIVEDEELEDPVTEISLPDALQFEKESEIGDELEIEIDPKSFDRVSVQSAKQKARQNFRDIHKDALYSEFKDKEGEMIIGYYQRERNDHIYVDLGKVEGILPKKFQSPREVYHPNDRIKAMIYEVNKNATGLQIILTRVHTKFVERIFELEVPEVYDKTVEIFKIVREPGYRTKLAVYSTREDVDPVGACVGLKGVRIQAVVRELEGEKIDILKYDNDPRTFIKNAMSPAEISRIVILDEAKRQALAIVPDTQLSLAIGKQGLNVRLANRLVDWSIDVKTESQFAEMDITTVSKKAAALFGQPETEEEITLISELPDISERLVELLKENKIDLIADLVALDDETLRNLHGISPEDVLTIRRIIDDNVEIIEEDDKSSSSEEEEESSEEEEGESGAEEQAASEEQAENEPAESEEKYECPECGHLITRDMTACPNCGVGLSFEVED